ncbi:uncharacterized protein F4822DRAFT_48336 [Hypoxylon trugodes]|uniref:uncharacterized protein n=1 Tax=Hypoxylon trugodes TaxID=326681 RepID=UPI00219EDD48|nr:uncharacterized protein F4822DRAFT_48336 [Hypoxylon trugodes]KAI1394464.1 hypothetical protein F4822DRAFT_48336 [Hypoxylon trugodes]
MSRAYPSDISSAAAGEISNMPKKRKIRKGTQSCWECKRRKIRCTFAAPTDSTCDGCKSRRTSCIGQEYQDKAALPLQKSNNDRLNRMESLVDQLVERNGIDVPQPDQGGNAPLMHRNTSPTYVVSATITSPNAEDHAIDDVDHLSRALLAVWPSQHDLDLILSIPVGVSVLLHGTVCQPYSTLLSGQIESPRRLLEPPSEKPHPVLVARKLLLLATLLQGISPPSAADPVGPGLDYHGIMVRAFNTATKLVTSNDEFTSCLELLECIMIESMYLNNAGNLRRAWLANRRAMAVAQMMGLHAGITSPTMAIEDRTWSRIHPGYMWFRIVASDRYLSLMLGLPQGSPENKFENLEPLDTCLAVERMERMESVASNLILQRNSAERTDLAATHKIDKMLQDAAAMMPPHWWATPCVVTTGNDIETFEETVRLTNQLVHHHLLVQLHLPYMVLPSSTELSYDYSKMTATNASRAIVALFLSFRSSVAAPAYCRGIDFIVFIASTTLCLAHIEARRQHRCYAEKGATVFQSLQHQRPSDLGLLERTLEVMETTAEGNRDIVAQKISNILRPLLTIENNSFKGDHYHIYASSEVDKDESQYFDDLHATPHQLHIRIPYFGIFQIEHRLLLPGSIESAHISTDEQLRNSFTSPAAEPSATIPCEDDSSFEVSEESTTYISRQCGYEIGFAHSTNGDWQTVPLGFGHPGSTNTNHDPGLPSPDINELQETYLLMPGLTADVDDWALQGVDMALFSNFTRGSTNPAHTR